MARFSSFPVTTRGLLAVPLTLVTTLTSQAQQRTVAVADRYEPVFDEFRHMVPQADRVATVRKLTLRRDVIEFALEEGKLYAAGPVAGRTIGVTFVGHGSVSFVPPLVIEQSEVQRVLGNSALHFRITAAAFVFTGSTWSELGRQVSFGVGGMVSEASGVLNDALDRLVDGRQSLQPTLITALLNGDDNGFFYAHVKREQGEDLMFVVDPEDEEQIQLLRGGRREGQKVQTISTFKRAEELSDSTPLPEGHDALKLDGYRIEASIPKGLGFSATATIGLTARRSGVGWARFELLSELAVDSVGEEGGRPLTFFRTKRRPELWVHFDPPLRAGETRALRVRYHGDLVGYSSVIENIQRHWPARVRSAVLAAPDQWLYVKTPTTWFPRYGVQAPTDVDLMFHTPKRYHFASVGRLIESRVDGDVETSHWHTVMPADQVCFSLGEFEEFKITDPRIPPVTVHLNADAHRRLDQFFLALRDQLGVRWDFVAKFLSQRDPQRDVGADVANSLAFFTHVYGPPLFDRYYAAEIPFSYGEAFPGLIYLPVWTFQAMSDSGYDEILRAHEMAHQWWGIGVEPATHRDWWLSEGFAEFSGLWYMQLILKDNDKFFKHLEHWRRQIRDRRRDASPIGVGTRASELNPRDYTLMTYHKGAWVVHMLRNLMLDLRTMKEDTFIAMMGDFYRQYRGRRATTRDFQRVVERHVGLNMSWFFNEWVEGTSIPRYILSWRAEPTQGGHYRLQVRVRQEDVPHDFIMPVPLKIGFADTALHALVRLNVSGPLTEAALELPAEPKRLELNALQSVLAEVKEEDWN
jgi:hypothetical protein